MDDRRKRARLGQRADIAMAMLDQPGDKGIATYTFNWAFAGRIDVRDQNDVGIVETGAEAVKEMGDASKAMRLNHRDQLTGDDCAGCFQNRSDFDRMMTVIVDNGHAIPLAGLGKAALDPFEVTQRSLQGVVAECHRFRNRRDGQRVLYIVPAEHWQKQVRDPASSIT